MNIWRLLAVSVIIGWPFNGNAAIRFLPDVDQQDVGVQTENANVNMDETLCKEAVDGNGHKLYHKADGCPQGMIFDEYCPHSQEWISECYRPQNNINSQS